MKKPNQKLIVLVSSTVYGIEELLDRVYTLLTLFGFEVWMSHKGTVPVSSERTAFEDCLIATERCDLFLGIITPHYGSGVDPNNGLSITHQEMRRAKELKKPRWILAHENVAFAWSLLKELGFEGSDGRKSLKQSKKKVLDLRVLDLFEEAIANHLPLAERQGNWVQRFRSNEDASLFVTAQFSRYQEVEQFIDENFKDLRIPSEDEATP